MLKKKLGDRTVNKLFQDDDSSPILWSVPEQKQSTRRGTRETGSLMRRSRAQAECEGQLHMGEDVRDIRV